MAVNQNVGYFPPAIVSTTNPLNYLNAVKPKYPTGSAAPDWFMSRYHAALNRLGRVLCEVPNDIADSLIGRLYPKGLIRAGADADQFASHLTIETHKRIIDLLIEPALRWVQAEYQTSIHGMSRLMTPAPWRGRIEPRVAKDVKQVYRRCADLMLVCEVVGAFYGLTELAGNKFCDLNLQSTEENWYLLAERIEEIAEALTYAYGYAYAWHDGPRLHDRATS